AVDGRLDQAECLRPDHPFEGHGGRHCMDAVGWHPWQCQFPSVPGRFGNRVHRGYEHPHGWNWCLATRRGDVRRCTQTARIYVNGVEQPVVRSGQATAIFDSDGPIRIGARMGSNGQITGAWNGLIDEVQLYNRALSAAEVLAIYSAGSAGTC